MNDTINEILWQRYLSNAELLRTYNADMKQTQRKLKSLMNLIATTKEENEEIRIALNLPKTITIGGTTFAVPEGVNLEDH